MKNAILIDSKKFQDYDFGPQHPLTPKRLQLTRNLIEQFNLIDGDGGAEEARYATDKEIQLIHGGKYIRILKEVSDPDYIGAPVWKYGLGPGDNPIFPNMYESSKLYVGGSLLAADLVMRGKTNHAFNISGGLHHAMGSKALDKDGNIINTGRDDRASGFCILNDCAITAAYLIKNYQTKKIVYLDVDAHAGDGVAYIYYKLPNVLTISIHQHPRTLFPGTCHLGEIGEGEGEGYCVNIPVMPYSHEEAYLKILDEAVAPIIKSYQPEVIITQGGVDTHFSDPLTMLALSTGTYKRFAKFIHELTHEASGGKWIALGGGGYSPDIVGKAWTLYFAEMSEQPSRVKDEVPASWINLTKDLISKTPAKNIIDDFDPIKRLGKENYDKINESADQLIARIKETIFPFHDL
ncbi:MAG: acetoin utilization protein AcuC [Candidatus Lokiarchaeota archaeon]|nr:acetoin utilization protein AcuC [Candidatus Lokiarchaeota archaeon]